ncbi:MAG: transposase [Planctomycetota bacterium]|jgi:REP element-mobilizing transposase RayT
MVGLLTWAAWGTWLAGPARGRVPGPDLVPEPDPALSAARRRGLVIPPVRLDRRHREAVADDLPRLAALRAFEVLALAVAADHVHLLVAWAGARDEARLVQLVKGALSRRLSVVEGDAPQVGTTGVARPHRRWWPRQHALRALADDDELRAVLGAIRAHVGPETLVRVAVPDPPPPLARLDPDADPEG